MGEERLEFEAVALQLPGQTAVRGEEGDEAGLDGVGDVGATLKDTRDGAQRAVELWMPAMRPVDHMGGEEAPDAPVPFFIEWVGVDGAERRGGADPLGAGPPEAVRLIRSVAPVERVVKAAKVPIPTN